MSDDDDDKKKERNEFNAKKRECQYTLAVADVVVLVVATVTKACRVVYRCDFCVCTNTMCCVPHQAHNGLSVCVCACEYCVSRLTEWRVWECVCVRVQFYVLDGRKCVSV